MTDKYKAGEVCVEFKAELTALKRGLKDAEKLADSAGKKTDRAFRKAVQNNTQVLINPQILNIDQSIAIEAGKVIGANVAKGVEESLDAKTFVSQFKADLSSGFGSFDGIRSQAKNAAISGVKGDGVKSALKKNLVAAVAVTAGETAIKAIGAALDQASTIQKSADQIGVSSQALQEYSAIARDANISQSDMNSALSEGANNVQAFIENGGGPAAEAIKALGLEQDITSGKLSSSEDVLKSVFLKLESVQGESRRAALAQKVFGEAGGKNLKDALNNGIGSMDETIGKAHALGQVFSKEATQSALEAKAAMAELSLTIKTNLNKAFVAVAPAIEWTVNKILNFIEVARTGIKVIGDLLQKTRRIRNDLIAPKELESLEGLTNRLIKQEEKLAKARDKLSSGGISGRKRKKYEKQAAEADEEIRELRAIVDKRLDGTSNKINYVEPENSLDLAQKIDDIQKLKDELKKASHEIEAGKFQSDFDKLLDDAGVKLFGPEIRAIVKSSGDEFANVIDGEISRLKSLLDEYETPDISALEKPKEKTQISTPVGQVYNIRQGQSKEVQEGPPEIDWTARGAEFRSEYLAPLEKYHERLKQIETIQSNPIASAAVGDDGKFIEAKVEALKGYASVTSDFQLANEALRDSINSGAFNNEHGLDLEAVIQAKIAIADATKHIEKQTKAVEEKINTEQAAFEKEKQLRLERNQLLIEEAEAKLLIAQVDGLFDTQQLEQSIRLLKEKRKFLQIGQSDSDAEGNAVKT